MLHKVKCALSLLRLIHRPVDEATLISINNDVERRLQREAKLNEVGFRKKLESSYNMSDIKNPDKGHISLMVNNFRFLFNQLISKLDVKSYQSVETCNFHLYITV